VGVVCGLGLGLPALQTSLRRHVVGHFSDDPLLNRRAIVPDQTPCMPEGYEDDRKVGWLMMAVAQALLDSPPVPAQRRGVFLGTGLSSVTPRELAEDVYPHVKGGRLDRESVMRDLSTDGVAPFRHLPARATGLVSRRWGATGPSLTTFSACAAGAEAIVAAARSIARGEIDVALAGGHDAMAHPLGMISFEVLGALSRTVGRPFDKHRAGFLLGEGAAVLRLQRADMCKRPLGYLIGAGSSIDAWGVTAPHPEGTGAERSMRRALKDAGVQAAEVDWVNAHATGTPVGDVAEARAIRRVFGANTPVSSLKGAVGHVLAAAGPVELAATLAAFQGDFIPGTVGCEQVDELGIEVVTQPRSGGPKLVLSNSFGFGGQNCSLLVAGPDWVRA
jgi:3-oxoacyl-[acyl-carrier-protein] synthase II